MKEQDIYQYRVHRLQALITDYFVQRCGMGLDKKLDLLRQKKEPYKDADNFVFYGYVIAKILENMKGLGDIENWLPTPPLSEFDEYYVDFIIEAEGFYIPLKFSGRHDDARKKRQNVRSKYGSNKVVPVIALHSRRDNPRKIGSIQKRIRNIVMEYVNVVN